MIVTVTLNASIDKVYTISGSVAPGTVMRVDRCQNSAGGKGLNVARVAALCKVPVKAAGIVGGYNGDYLLKLLEQDGVPHEFFRVDGETRSCINILAGDHTSTEFLEPGFMVTEDEQGQFLDFFRHVIADSGIVTISGSAPRGFGKEIYAELIEIAKKAGKLVMLDTSGAYLKAALTAAPDFIKPNREELDGLFGCRIDTIREVKDWGLRLHGMGIKYVLVSLGADGAVLVCDGGVYHGKPGEMKAVNPVGCGDSMVASFAAALERKQAPEECLSYAVAVSAANALSMRTGYFEQENLDTILGGVIVSRI